MLGVSPLKAMNIAPSGGVSPENVTEWFGTHVFVVVNSVTSGGMLVLAVLEWVATLPARILDSLHEVMLCSCHSLTIEKTRPNSRLREKPG